MRIACWSGPRNLSTAMMYAFGARTDCAVMDEPFYAPFLRDTGRPDPMREEIVAGHEADPERVAALCSGPIPGGRPHLYLKLMALHMLPAYPLGWATGCVHVHLLRHPARVVASYGAKRDGITADDIGFRQQAEIFDRVGGLVIDSAEIRRDPPAMLAALCAAIGLPFDPSMLVWPRGGHASDGVWAAHWYGAIHDSTGFAGPEGPLPQLDGDAARLADGAMPVYEQLYDRRIRPQ
ncbi:sulfotransferase family protein [Roseisalinus antarcticus]|uniref:Branched-chain amino acid aminotransferase n=1 Tax=Roseisalinus antarcticus TaxID=254357 RepID=A0A1Y5S6Y4_9RHOB|nr:sulfotransferase family protein [Roseisalinus antarcticus]SLN32631.1 hypothetical protein ROA7023_01124 [Roseisalinus antarcticus]